MSQTRWAHLEARSVRRDGWTVVRAGEGPKSWVVYRGDAPQELWRGKATSGKRRGPVRRWFTRKGAVRAVDLEVVLPDPV